MGLGFVLLIWAVVWAVLATVGALVLGGATALLTRAASHGRRTVIIAAALFPFICVAWGAAVFVFQAIINETVLSRDLGLGDTAHCPLPNGYHIMMIDTTDQGWIYNPKTQRYGGVVGSQDDAVDGVRVAQVAGRYILGASDTKLSEHFGQNTKAVDSYFWLDTKTGKKTVFSNYDDLRSAAGQLGVSLKLEPIYNVYRRYRFTWFDVFAGFLLLAPPLVSAYFLFRWIARVRRTRESIPQAV